LISVVLYKTGDFFNDVTSSDVILILRDDVLAMLDDVWTNCSAQNPFAPVEQYTQWIRKQCRRDTLIQHPAFQTWFYARNASQIAPHALHEWFVQQWEPGIRRAVQWEVMTRLASSISTFSRYRVRQHLCSDWNHSRGDYSAWTNFPILTWENGEDCAFYRLDAGWFDFRIYAGPPRGVHSEEKGEWVRLKHEMLEVLRQELTAIPLHLKVQLAGSDYPFHKGAKETSMCRVSLEAESLDNLIAEFPTLHHAIVRAMQVGSSKNKQWTLLSIFTEIPGACPEIEQAYKDRD
jgi:hypothetical protein